MKQIATFSLLFLSLLAFGQEVKIEKTFDESFYINRTDKVNVTNKYGEIVINTWFADSVKIVVRATAEGKNQDMAAREMERVEIEMRKVGSHVYAETKFVQPASRKGFFGEIISQVEEVSKSVVGTDRIAVDYEIWIPVDQSISIENKFGDIYLPTMEGVVNLTSSHGNIRGDRVEGELILRHSFGKSSFDFVRDGDITLRGADSKIGNAETLMFESSSSEIRVGKVDQVQFNSRNDKYDFEEVNDMIGEGVFTDLKVEMLLTEARLDFNYGEIFLTRVEKFFNRLEINGKSCDINLILDQASYISTRISGEMDKMILPNSMLGMKKEELDEERISLSGHVGNTNTEASELNVNAESGNLIISIKETDIFTHR
ncbi:MAG: hypothetical protein JXQ90_11045 [Cyclobacteriaceae bacterium]